MKKILLFILVFLYISAYAQKPIQSKIKTAQKAYEQAGQFLSSNLYDSAIEKLKEAISLDNGFTAAYQQLGDIYRKTLKFELAKPNYLKVISIDPEFYQGTYFGLAESELNTGDYQQALIHFTKYAAYPGLSESSKTLISKYIRDCEFSLPAIKIPVPFKPVNVGPTINTTAEEYLPVVTADEQTLIFTRRINQNEDFYKSDKDSEKWGAAQYLSREINTDVYNEGAQCISPDGLYLFFTGCNRPDGLGRCDIYFSKREGKSWSKPFNLGAPVNTPGWESQPSLSADGRTLYFASTRPGGLGGYDIWKADLKADGGWTTPVNLGSNINTSFDEQSPFIHHDGQTLYFSSNGWPGFGNRDVFLSRKDTLNNWQKPVNLGYPINSFAEEAGLSISTDGKTAFYSANKNGGQGGLDIYFFELPVNIRPKPVTYVKGVVFDKKTKELLDAEIKMISLTDALTVYDDISDPESGEFLATMPAGKNFALNIKKEGYLFYSGNFSLEKPSSAGKPFNIKVPLEKIELGASAILNNIFFETNKYSLLSSSKTELMQLIDFLTINSKVSIEIAGHTDNIGDDKMNQTLSENRAKSVYDFLVGNKIAPSRLMFRGYGKNFPMSDNTTEEGRKINRRTEFKVIKVN